MRNLNTLVFKMTADQFWQWFKENNTAYTFLGTVEEGVKEQLLDEFLEKLHNYCDQLYFEIGGDPCNNTELIITASGNIKYFGKVEELIARAPVLHPWIFIALKPPTKGHFKSRWESLELNSEDLWFLSFSKAGSTDLGIRVCLKNYELIKSNKALMPLLYIMIDTLLGERSAALDIKYVDANSLPDQPKEKGLYPIEKLPAFLAYRISRL